MITFRHSILTFHLCPHLSSTVPAEESWDLMQGYVEYKGRHHSILKIDYNIKHFMDYVKTRQPYG